MCGGGRKRGYNGAGEGVTNRVPSVPFVTICQSEATDRVGASNRVGIASTLTRLFTRVTNRVVVTNRVATLSRTAWQLTAEAYA